MQVKLLAVYDNKAEGFKPPIAVNSIGEGERSFRDACANKETDFGMHPEDYSLWCVGTFNVLSGETTPEKYHVCNGHVAQPMEVKND